MTTLIVNVDNKKSEKAIKAVLDALGVSYNEEKRSDMGGQELTHSEQIIYNRLKRTAEEIKRYQQGEIELQSAEDYLNEL